MRWENEWSFDGQLFLEYLYQNLLKSNNSSFMIDKFRCVFYASQCSNTVVTVIMFKYTRNRNHTITKFVQFVCVVCANLCAKFCNKRSTFDKVIVKILKIPMVPSLQTRAWPPSVFILRGVSCIDCVM